MYNRAQLTGQYIDLINDRFPFEFTSFELEDLTSEMSLEELAHAVEHFDDLAADY